MTAVVTRGHGEVIEFGVFFSRCIAPHPLFPSDPSVLWLVSFIQLVRTKHQTLTSYHFKPKLSSTLHEHPRKQSKRSSSIYKKNCTHPFKTLVYAHIYTYNDDDLRYTTARSLVRAGELHVDSTKNSASTPVVVWSTPSSKQTRVRHGTLLYSVDSTK